MNLSPGVYLVGVKKDGSASATLPLVVTDAGGYVPVGESKVPGAMGAGGAVAKKTVKKAWITLHTADVKGGGTDDVIIVSMKNKTQDERTVTELKDTSPDQLEKGMVEKYSLDDTSFKKVEGAPYGQFFCDDPQHEPYELVIRMEKEDANDWYVRGAKLEVECADIEGKTETRTLIEDNAVNQVLGKKKARTSIVLTRDDTAVMIELKVSDEGDDPGTNNDAWVIFPRTAEKLSALDVQQITNYTNAEPFWVAPEITDTDFSGQVGLLKDIFKFDSNADVAKLIAKHLNYGIDDDEDDENDLRKGARLWYGGTLAEQTDPIEEKFLIAKKGTDGLALDEIKVAVYRPGSDAFIKERGDCVKYTWVRTGDEKSVAIDDDQKDATSRFWPAPSGTAIQWQTIETKCCPGDIPFKKIEQDGTEFPADCATAPQAEPDQPAAQQPTEPCGGWSTQLAAGETGAALTNDDLSYKNISGDDACKGIGKTCRDDPKGMTIQERGIHYCDSDSKWKVVSSVYCNTVKDVYAGSADGKKHVRAACK